MMTWHDLLEFIVERGKATEGGFLDENVTLYDQEEGEFYPVDTIEFTDFDDVLDAGTVFLTFN
jgi:hypothetical protein